MLIFLRVTAACYQLNARRPTDKKSESHRLQEEEDAIICKLISHIHTLFVFAQALKRECTKSFIYGKTKIEYPAKNYLIWQQNIKSSEDFKELLLLESCDKSLLTQQVTRHHIQAAKLERRETLCSLLFVVARLHSMENTRLVSLLFRVQNVAAEDKQTSCSRGPSGGSIILVSAKG